MAELYAKQGYRAAALDVYRQLALNNPEDREILSRIEELSGEPAEVPRPITAESIQSAPEQPAMEALTVESQADEESEAAAAASHATEPEALVSEVSVEEAEATAPEAEGGEESTSHVRTAELYPELDETLVDWVEASSAIVYAPSDEDLNLTAEPVGTDSGTHFTEHEISNGDAWDTDSWAAGFSSDEPADLAFDAPDTVLETPAAAAATEPLETASEAGQIGSEVETAESSAFPSESASVDSAAVTSEEQLPAGTPTEREEPEYSEGEVTDEDSAVVAYSPQPPAPDELAHFIPKGPTIREFFATLGARRAVERDREPSFTARAAIPSVATVSPAAEESADSDMFEGYTEPEPETEAETEPEQIVDAFADLFPGEQVSDEDTRAAFALSGAVSSAPSPSAPPATPARRTPVSNPVIETAQESEEDIRRFREWLDGLADS
jgi:hypothetical protein